MSRIASALARGDHDPPSSHSEVISPSLFFPVLRTARSAIISPSVEQARLACLVDRRRERLNDLRFDSEDSKFSNGHVLGSDLLSDHRAKCPPDGSEPLAHGADADSAYEGDLRQRLVFYEVGKGN
jgi:hypothetical protein